MDASQIGRTATPELGREHGLTPDEWAKVVELLGRAPTIEELSSASSR
jgi:hypothetical protein